MKCNLFLISFLFLVSFVSKVSGQFGVEKMNVIPPSPDAMNLGKFIETPVSLYTGTSNITIPIWTIEQGQISIPISLSYHAGGINVSEIASWVGLGWNLNCGGMVSRSIMGLPDEVDGFGFWDTVNPTVESALWYWNDWAKGKYDGQPDRFYYSTPENSGKFVFDKNENYHFIPFSNNKLEYSDIGTVSRFYPYVGIKKWLITSDKGIKYYFETFEVDETYQRVVGSFDLPYKIGTVNTWHLSKIVAGVDTVFFNYDDYSISYDMSMSFKFYARDQGSGCEIPKNYTYHVQRKDNKVKKLSSISFKNGTVRFIPQRNQRADLIGDYALKSIVVENVKGDIVKQFDFSYKYLIGNELVDPSAINTDGEDNYIYSTIQLSNPLYRRLILEGVSEKNSVGDNKDNGYKFEYIHDLGLPHKMYRQVDHWGFANNRELVKPDLPRFMIHNEPGGTMYTVIGKEPVLGFAKQGTLNKITYPTGGYTEYSYDLNAVRDKILTSSVNFNHYSIGMMISHAYCNATDLIPKEEYPYDIKMIGGMPVKYHYQEFTINNYTLFTDINISLSNIPFNIGVMGFYIVDVNDLDYKIWNGYENGDFNIGLKNGTYRLYHFPYANLLQDENHENYDILYNAILSWESTGNKKSSEVPVISSYNVGGLRIREITSFDSDEKQVLSKKYNYTKVLSDGSETTESSGLIFSSPIYTSYMNVTCEGSTSLGVSYYIFSCNSFLPLSSYSSSFAEYSCVTEYIEDNNSNANGKTVFFYSNPKLNEEIPIGSVLQGIKPTFPFTPIDNMEFLRGRLLKKVEYSSEGNSYNRIRQVEYKYNHHIEEAVTGLVVEFYHLYLFGDMLGESYSANYSVYTGYVNLKEEIVTDFSSGGNVVQSKGIEYGVSPLLPMKTSIKSSNSTTKYTYTLFPLDYGEKSDMIQNMIEDNILSKPTEKVIVFENALGNKSILSGQLFSYDRNSFWSPISISGIEEPNSIPIVDFKFSNVAKGFLPNESAHYSFKNDPRYKVKLTLDYNEQKIIEQTFTDNIKESYLWGYNNQYLIAKIENATIDDIKSALSVTTIDFGSGGLNSSQESTLRTDSKLANALITTYTYDSLIGMTSETDPNGRTTYYEYDSFGRLQYIKDQDANIIKKYEYNYATQTTN